MEENNSFVASLEVVRKNRYNLKIHSLENIPIDIHEDLFIQLVEIENGTPITFSFDRISSNIDNLESYTENEKRYKFYRNRSDTPGFNLEQLELFNLKGISLEKKYNLKFDHNHKGPYYSYSTPLTIYSENLKNFYATIKDDSAEDPKTKFLYNQKDKIRLRWNGPHGSDYEYKIWINDISISKDLIKANSVVIPTENLRKDNNNCIIKFKNSIGESQILSYSFYLECLTPIISEVFFNEGKSLLPSSKIKRNILWKFDIPSTNTIIKLISLSNYSKKNINCIVNGHFVKNLEIENISTNSNENEHFFSIKNTQLEDYLLKGLNNITIEVKDGALNFSKELVFNYKVNLRPSKLFPNYKGYKLFVHESLVIGEFLTSENLKYVLNFEEHGNLVIYDINFKVLWASNTYFTNPENTVRVGSDGKLNILSGNKEVLWKSNHPENNSILAFVLSDSGKLEVIEREEYDVDA